MLFDDCSSYLRDATLVAQDWRKTVTEVSEKTIELVKNVHMQFSASIALKQQLCEGSFFEQLVLMAEKIAVAIKNGGKLMLCGNGGSAADAQHLAAELLVRLRSDCNRESLPAISLALDTSTLTACGNDYGFDRIYERAVEGLGKPGDILLAITTSGRSKNILLALDMAKKKGITTLGFLGGTGGSAAALCQTAFVVPSSETNRIQEVHITAGHVLMDLVEKLVINT